MTIFKNNIDTWKKVHLSVDVFLFVAVAEAGDAAVVERPRSSEIKHSHLLPENPEMIEA